MNDNFLVEIEQSTSYEELQNLAAKSGIQVTPKQLEAVHQRYAETLKSITENEDSSRKWHERLNAAIPSMQSALTNLAAFLYVFIARFSSTVLVPITLIGIMFGEVWRVQHGLMIFEASPLIAWVLAIVFVLANTVIEFTIFDIEHRAGYQAPPQKLFSFRIVVNGLYYLLGIGEHWQAVTRSPAHHLHKMGVGLKWTILLLALFGSMGQMLSGLEGNIVENLDQLEAETSLYDLAAWILVFLTAVSLVGLTRALTAYLAQEAVYAVDNSVVSVRYAEIQAEKEATYLLKSILIKKAQKLQEQRKEAHKTMRGNFPDDTSTE